MNERAVDGPALLELVRSVTARGGFVEVRVHGGSMFPTLAERDRVRLGPPRAAPGALVLAEVDGQPMLHRVVCREGPSALLAADACGRKDWVRCERIVGEVCHVQRSRPRWAARARRWWARRRAATAALLLFAGFAATSAQAQCKVTPYIVVDGQSCDWTPAERPLVIPGNATNPAGSLVISQTELTDNYNTASTGNGNLYGLMTFASGTNFQVNAQVGLFILSGKNPKPDAACNANYALSFTCTANPCTTSTNWTATFFTNLSGNACQTAAQATTLTLTGANQQAAFAINGTTIEFGANFAAMGLGTTFSASPYSTTNLSTNTNLDLDTQTAYNATTVGPSAARVSALAARAESGGVTLGWTTHAEPGNVGFFVWRSRDGGPFALASPNPVRGQMNGMAPAGYRFHDPHGRAGDVYRISDVDRRRGALRPWGPTIARVSAALPEPVALPRLMPHPLPLPLVHSTVARVAVQTEGMYRVDAAALAAAGVASPEQAGLSFWGEPVRLERRGAGWIFYAPPVRNAYDGTDAYLLTAGFSPPSPSSVNLDIPVTAPADVRSRLHLKQYFAYDWYHGGDDPYIWAWSSNLFPVDPATFDLPAPARVGTSTVTVHLLGGTAFAHHVQVQLNGVTLGEAQWTGEGAQSFQAALPEGLLQVSNNALSVVTVFDTGAPFEFVELDSIDLDYARAPVAVAGEARFELPAGACTAISGLGVGAAAWDVTRPGVSSVPLWTGLTRGALVVCAPRDGLVHQVEAFDDSALRTPAVQAAPLNTLRNPENAADELLIVHPSLAAAVQPILAARAAQGLRVQAVSLWDVYDAFGFGNAGRTPIRDFLTYARTAWRSPPRYVLLVGGANTDVRDILGTGIQDLIPAGIVMAGPEQMRAASDGWYTTGADGVTPLAAIGRIPADTLADAQAVVQKILAGDQQGPATHSALLAADVSLQSNDADFAGESVLAGGWLSSAGTLSAQVSAGDANAPAELASALGQGVDVLHYLGHAGTSVWGEQEWFGAAQVLQLQNARLPLWASFDCLDGMFDNPTTTAMGWAALKNGQGGALASFVPSTILDPREAVSFDREVMQSLTGAQGRLGDALLVGLQHAAQQPVLQDFVRTYNLLGDPASPNPLR